MKKNMRKKLCIAFIALVVVTVVVLVGCTGKSGSDEGSASVAQSSASSEAAGDDSAAQTSETPAAGDDSGAPASETAGEDGSDLAYVKENGTLKIGITIFEPMNYHDDAGKLTGFDTDFAEAVCEKFGVTPEFVEINWDTKALELKSKNIDCIWNGFTVRPDLAKELLVTDSYMKNMQVAVIRAKDVDEFKTIEDIAKANIVAELSSAGEEAVQNETALASATYTAMPKQADTLLEVKAGTADVAVLDYTAAKSMVGEGTDYSDLMIIPGVEFAAEEYAIGFRLGSDIVPEINKAIVELTEDGTLDEIAGKYNLTASLISNQ
jgi:polar amino acid transport system substrate-binding protein